MKIIYFQTLLITQSYSDSLSKFLEIKSYKYWCKQYISPVEEETKSNEV